MRHFRSIPLVLALFASSILFSCATPQKSTSAPQSGAPQATGATTPSTVPKYAPTTIPLSRDHRYFRAHAAADFWALAPYYVPQEEHACQAASYSMIINAWRSRGELKSDQELAQQRALVETSNEQDWKDATVTGNCLSLDRASQVLQAVLRSNGFPKASVEATHADDENAATLRKLLRALASNERSSDDFILANFAQGVLTGDPEAIATGHVSLIGAYDAIRKRVLIMDVDRKWYEPYWVAVKTLLAGMHTLDQGTNQYRGFMTIRIAE